MTWAEPSEAVLAWVAGSVGVDSARWSRRLVGGTHALTDVVRTSDTHELALRRFPSGDDAVHREARVLAEIAGLDELAPLLLAADPDGAQTGTPAILTTLLPGHACITPDDSYGAARQLGRALARIHAHPAGPGLPTVLTAPAQDARGVAVSASAVAGLRLAWGRLATSAQVLTHNDFWSGNTLWAAGQLTGVVDWSGAGLAPRGFDLSWARLDLFLLHDRAVADAMTSSYETAAGLNVSDIDVWDVYAATNAHAGIEGWAPNHRDLGRPDLGPAELRRRLGEWMLPTFTTEASAAR